MVDGYVQLPVDGAGKKLDTESLTVGANGVHRERMQVAGELATQIARVLNSDPDGAEYGLVVRPVETVVEAHSALTSSALAAGASTDLDGATIPLAATGKLLKALLSSTAACKWIIKKRDGGVEVTVDVVFTSGLAGGSPSFEWSVPDKGKNWHTQLGDGVDTNFRVTATNLDKGNAADVYAGLYWDEA